MMPVGAILIALFVGWCHLVKKDTQRRKMRDQLEVTTVAMVANLDHSGRTMSNDRSSVLAFLHVLDAGDAPRG